MSAERVDLTKQERERLADEVYDFLVSNGYHAHYPSAEAQAVKCVLGGLGVAVERIVAARVQQARAEALLDAAEMVVTHGHDGPALDAGRERCECGVDTDDHTGHVARHLRADAREAQR